ncbi:MAG: DUF1203 domain-containing protein [Saprospiraceae bacterium]
MTIDFQIRALDERAFAELFTLDPAALAKMGIVRRTVDKKPGFPCRISLEDAEVGEEVLLLPYQYHKTDSPYQASGPIFIRRTARTADLRPNEIPKMLDHRLLSVRGYDQAGMMLEATVVEGKQLRANILQLFERPEIAYLHLHNAKPGCYNCLVERAK